MNRNDDLLNIALKTEQAGCRKDDTQCCGRCKKPTIEELEAQVKRLSAERDAVLAESAEIQKRTQQLIDIINKADNSYCMCGEAMKNHGHGGCGHPTGMFDYHYGRWSEYETPATDAILASLRAEVIEWMETEISAIDTTYRGDPSYEHDAYWMKNEVLDVAESAKNAFCAQLRSKSEVQS